MTRYGMEYYHYSHCSWYERAFSPTEIIQIQFLQNRYEIVAWYHPECVHVNQTTIGLNIRRLQK